MQIQTAQISLFKGEIAELNHREKLVRAAALIDSDGNILIDGKTWGFGCGYTSTDPIIPNWLQSTFGGSVRADTSVARRNPNAKVIYRWSLRATNAATFLREIYPFLLIKAEQAKTVLELHKTLESVRGKRGVNRSALCSRFKEKIAKLNQRGSNATNI